MGPTDSAALRRWMPPVIAATGALEGGVAVVLLIAIALRRPNDCTQGAFCGLPTLGWFAVLFALLSFAAFAGAATWLTWKRAPSGPATLGIQNLALVALGMNRLHDGDAWAGAGLMVLPAGVAGACAVLVRLFGPGREGPDA